MNQSHIVEEAGNGLLEIFPLQTDTERLKRLLTDIFENYWDRIFFGSAVQGKEPIWEHLELWDHLRQAYLGLPADTNDRRASRLVCG